jgi:ubiquinone/menaquinone biosynthesis C-methylase UbiE
MAVKRYGWIAILVLGFGVSPAFAQDREHADHSFADVERYAARFESPERAAWQKPDEVVAALGVKAGMTVADIGAGTGYFSRRFAQVVGPAGSVFAVDLEPNMLVYLRQRAEQDGQANLIPVLASQDDPRLPDGSVDLIFICDTWHHIRDRVNYARRLQQDLAPGGRVVIVDFLPGELPVGPPPEAKLSADQVKAEFAQAGYRLAGSPDLLPYQYVLIFELARTTPAGN